MSERSSDHRQRQAAVTGSDSYVVQAPAGSGKTELLTNRFLRLLAGVERPHRILAITFTRKATQEMRDRLQLRLRQAAAGERPGPPHEREACRLAAAVLQRDHEHGWNLMNNPAQLQVYTIDGLCSRLAARGDESGRGLAGLRVTEHAESLYAEAARRLVERIGAAADDSDAAVALGRLLARLRGNAQRLQDLLVTELGRRDQWLDRVAGARPTGAGVLAARQARELDLLDAVLGAGHLDGLAGWIADLPTQPGVDTPDVAPAQQSSGRDTPGARAEAVHAMLKAVAVKSGEPMAPATVRSRLGPNGAGLGKDALEGIAGLCEGWRSDPQALVLFQRWVKTPPLDLAPGNRQLMVWMHDLLVQGYAELRVVFLEQGVCDFQFMADLARAALGAEGEPGEALLLEDGRLEHILMDEFQDTSQMQFDLLQRLVSGWQPGDGRSLFLVGDPMQSIYRFRKADVALFQRVFEEQRLGDLPVRALRLTSNFRSRREVVEFVNRECTRVFTPPSPAATGAVAYVPVAAELGDGGRVHMHPNPESLGAAFEAAQIADLVREAVAGEPEATIGILGRARSQLEPVAVALTRAGVSYEALDVQGLAGQPVVQDLIILVRALLHPADRVAWLALLHGPWCGLGPRDMHVLAGDDSDADLLVLMANAQRLARLPAASRQRVERLAGVMQEAIAAAWNLALHRRVEIAWIRLRGPCAVDTAVGLQDAEAFLDLLARLERERPPDLLAELERRLRSLRAASERSRVQLMTIHKAKGLEFDRVIVPGLEGRTPPDGQVLFRHHEFVQAGVEGALLAPVKAADATQPALYDYLGRLQREESISEAQRVLYVALTRARRNLHLFGRWHWYGSKNKKKPGAPGGSFMDLLWTPFHRAIQDSGQLDDATRATPPAPTADAAPLPMLVLDGEPGPVIGAQVADSSCEPLDFRLPDRDTLALGEAFHQWMELLHDHWSGAWRHNFPRAAMPALESTLRNAGARPESLGQLREQLAKLLEQALVDPTSRELLTPEGKPASLAEAAFCRVRGDRLSISVVDRLWRDADARWHIVDYKTSDGGASARQAWAAQLEGYRELVALESGEEVAECRIYRTADGRLLEVDESG